MKKITSFMLMLLCAMTAMAQFTQNYYMNTNFWSNAVSCPAEISTVLEGAEYGDGTAWKGDNSVVQYASNEITVETDGNVVVTFTHQGGNHMLCILGVDVVDAEGNVVKNDYHVGSAGGSLVNNVYTLEGLTAGATLTLRSFVCDNTAKGDRTAKAQGYYTVTNVVVATTPAVDTDGDELAANLLYRLKHMNSGDKYLHITQYNVVEKIQIKSKSNSTDQFFELVPTGSANEYKLKSASGYYVQNTGSWNCQAVTSGSTPYLVEEKEEGIYLLKSAQGYFGTNEGVVSDGAPVYTNHPANRNGATWTFEKVGADVVNTLAGFNPNKMYTVSTTTRGGWSVGETSERFESTTDGGLGTVVDPTNTRNQFAVLSANGTDYYLFSVHANKFVKADRTMVEGVADALNFTDASSQGAGRVMVNFRDINNKYINLGGSNQMTINAWGAAANEIDGGNSVLFVECGDFDPTEALAMLSNVATVTYKFMYNGKVVATQEIVVNKGDDYPAFNIPNMPLGIVPAEGVPAGTVESDIEKEITLTVNNELIPFDYVADGETPTVWYYARMHGNPSVTSYIEDNGSNTVEWSDKNIEVGEIDSHLWGFVGDAFNGFKMVNKDSKNAIASTGSGVASMTEVSKATAFHTMPSDNSTSGAFCLKYKGNNNYLNAQGSAVNHWDDNDNGSTFFLTEYANEDVATITVSEVNYATLFLGQSVFVPQTVEAYIVSSVSDDWAHMEPVTGILPANTGIILKNAGEHTFVAAPARISSVGENLLTGTLENAEIVKEADKEYYILANKNGIGLYNPIFGEDETKFNNAANKAYLVLDKASGAAMSASLRFDFGGTTGIEEVEIRNEKEEIYDLTGRRVNEITKAGVYIIGGRKVMVK